MYRYGEDDPKEKFKFAPRNSTYLSDTEYDAFLKMSKEQQKTFLLTLGQREWDAMEEVRLMEEECTKTQIECDSLIVDLKGTDLLK